MSRCETHEVELKDGENFILCGNELDELKEDYETQRQRRIVTLEKNIELHHENVRLTGEAVKLEAENEKLRSQDSDNIRIVGAALRCFPEPASEMLDDQLEKPLVVVDRIRTENEMLLDSVKEAFLSGYSQGNHAAVESMGYSADESANEYMEDIENKTQEPE